MLSPTERDRIDTLYRAGVISRAVGVVGCYDEEIESYLHMELCKAVCRFEYGDLERYVLNYLVRAIRYYRRRLAMRDERLHQQQIDPDTLPQGFDQLTALVQGEAQAALDSIQPDSWYSRKTFEIQRARIERLKREYAKPA